MAYNVRARSYKDGYLRSIIQSASSATNMGALPTSSFPVPFRIALIEPQFLHAILLPFSDLTQGCSSTLSFWFHLQIVPRFYVADLPLLTFVLTTAGELLSRCLNGPHPAFYGRSQPV
jgi:hypothetical protein